MILIFLGSPGSGKGTISANLINKGFKHISTGDLFRNLSKQDNDLSKKVKQIMESGKYVDDITTFEVLENALLKLNLKEEKLILDGYPRNINQVDTLNNFLSKHNIEKPKIIYFEISEEEVIKRLSGRRICPICKTIYHIKNNPPINKDLCDKDNTPLTIRSDDQKEKIQTRLNVYNQQTVPIIKFYSKTANFLKLDAIDTAENLTKKVLENV